MELVVAALLVVVVVEAMVIYRFKRRADLLKAAMERDRAVFMRDRRPAPDGRPPEPVVGGRTGRGAPPHAPRASGTPQTETENGEEAGEGEGKTEPDQ